MDEFVLFAFLLFMANKSNLSVHFLGESTARQSAFWFYLTFNRHLFFPFFVQWNLQVLSPFNTPPLLLSLLQHLSGGL